MTADRIEFRVPAGAGRARDRAERAGGRHRSAGRRDGRGGAAVGRDDEPARGPLRGRARHHAGGTARQAEGRRRPAREAHGGGRHHVPRAARAARFRLGAEAGVRFDVERRVAEGRRRQRGASGGPLRAGHLCLRPRHFRSRHPAPGVSAPDETAAGRVGRARPGTAVQVAVRSADHGVDRREGDGPAVGARHDRRRLRQPPEARHAAADRSHGHLRTRREVRRQPAQARPRHRRSLQLVHARRACRRPRSRCRAVPRSRRR